MDDQAIVARIGELMELEHRLENTHATSGALGADEQARMRSVEVALDQCWDLLRQRRARRDVGRDPDDAVEREAHTVEGYRQ